MGTWYVRNEVRNGECYGYRFGSTQRGATYYPLGVLSLWVSGRDLADAESIVRCTNWNALVVDSSRGCRQGVSRRSSDAVAWQGWVAYAGAMAFFQNQER